MADETGAPVDSIGASLRDVLSGAAISVLGFAVLRAAGLGEKILIARFFDPGRYGQVVLAVSLLSLATLVGSLGLQTGVVRYLPRYDSTANRSRVVTAALGLALATSVVLAGATVLSAEWLATTVFDDPDLSALIEIVALGVPLAVLGQLGASVARGEKDAGWNNLIENVTFPLSRVALVAVAVLAGFGTVGIAWAYVGGYAVMALVAAAYVYAAFDVPSVSDLEYGRLLRFSLPLLFANGMSFVSSTLDTILIATYLTSTAVGVYGAAYPLARLVFLVPSLMGVIFTPVMSELHAEGDLGEMRDVYGVVTKWIVVLTLPGVAMLALHPGTFLRFVFGESYVAGSTALAILAVGFFYHVVLGINGGTLNMLGESDFFLASTVVNAAVNVGLNVWLVPRVGIDGAAVATAVSYAAGNTLVSLRLYRAYDVTPFRANNLVTYAVLAPTVGAVALALGSILEGVALVLAVYLVSVPAFLVAYVASDAPTSEERAIVADYRAKLSR